MPTECRLTAEVSGEAQGPNGLPTRLVVFGRASRDCTRVHVTIRLAQDGPSLLSTETPVGFPPAASADPLDPVNDGLWRAESLLPASAAIPCGLPLWVEVRCVAGGGECSLTTTRNVRCKWAPGAAPGGGGPGGMGEDAPGGGLGGWPWPEPPHITCPGFGRVFVTLLLAGLVALVLGVALASVPLIASGGALLSAAGVVYWIWRHWCAPNTCYLLGGIAWALKRAIVVGIAAALLTQSVRAAFLVLCYGATVGIVVADLRRRRCSIPRTATPVQQLPLW